jgi:Domain of unknown function (DUF222)
VTDAELLEDLDELTLEIEGLTARRLQRLREVDTRGLAEFDGYRSTPAWLSFRYRHSRRTTAADIRLARHLGLMPHTEAALESGAITLDHARRLARVRNGRTQTQFDLDEQQLLANAANLSFQEFENMTRYWEQHADPDGAEQAEQRAIEDRNLSLSRLNDEWIIRGTSDLMSGSQISEALSRIEQELFDADWAEAKQRVGDDVCLADLTRTNAQRRHDSFLEMARRATATQPNCKPPEPLVTIVMDYQTFVEQGLLHADATKTGTDGAATMPGSGSVRADRRSELLDGTPIRPESAFRIAIESQLSRIVMQGASIVLDAGRSTRYYTGALRRAIIIRDRTCCWPGCHVPATHSEIDHHVEYQHGGHTSERNAKVYCAAHHAKKHCKQFSVKRDKTGEVAYQRADGTPIKPLIRPPPS